MKLRHVHHWTFDKLICAISIICLAVVLVLVLVLKDFLRTYFKSLSLSLGSGPCPWVVRSRKSLSLGSGPCPCPGPWGQVLVLVLGGVRSLLTSVVCITRHYICHPLQGHCRGKAVQVNISDVIQHNTALQLPLSQPRLHPNTASTAHPKLTRTRCHQNAPASSYHSCP